MKTVDITRKVQPVGRNTRTEYNQILVSTKTLAGIRFFPAQGNKISDKQRGFHHGSQGRFSKGFLLVMFKLITVSQKLNKIENLGLFSFRECL